MSIDNMLVAVEEAENRKEADAILFSHLTPQNGFHVRRTPEHPSVPSGMFAIDLNAPSIDAVYLHPDGYLRLRSIEEVCAFLCFFISQEEVEKILKELGYEELSSV